MCMFDLQYSRNGTHCTMHIFFRITNATKAFMCLLEGGLYSTTQYDIIAICFVYIKYDSQLPK
jgi:hypothetical protein